MIKRRSNRTFFLGGGLLFVFLTVALSGCKKTQPPPPPQPQTMPLPKKTEQPQAAPAAGQKPVQAAPTSAKMAAAKADSSKTPIQGQVSTAKRLSPSTSISLDFANRRDPFKPYAQLPTPQQSAAGRISKGKVHNPLPIQTFDTEKFKVSGIVTGLKENSALVLDPNGKGYVVKAGMQIGNNDGFIKKITSSTVEVEESFRDDNGRVRKRLVKLTLIRKK